MTSALASAGFPRWWSAATPPVLFVGIGGAGSRIVGRMAKSPRPGEAVACIDSCAKSLGQCAVERKLHIEVRVPSAYYLPGGKPLPDRLLLGETVNSDCSIAQQAVAAHHGLAAMDQRDRIERLFGSNRIVVLVAGLGGITGGGMILEVAEVARTTGRTPFAVGVMPFNFEGTARNWLASQCAQYLAANHGDRIRLVEAEKLVGGQSQEISLGKAFRRLEAHAMKHARDLVGNPIAG